MKTFKDSTLDYKCLNCGVGIYNAVYDYNLVCPECGGKLKKIKRKEKK